MDRTPDKVPTLDYATPVRSKHSALAPVAAVFGVLSGLFGSLVLFYGVDGILWLVRDWKGVDQGDVFGVAVVNLIGAICGFFAIRWILFAVRDLRGSGGR